MAGVVSVYADNTANAPAGITAVQPKDAKQCKKDCKKGCKKCKKKDKKACSCTKTDTAAPVNTPAPK
jgi:hypothetical protein